MSIKNTIKDLIRPIFYKAMHPRIIRLRDSSLENMRQYKNKYEGKRCFIIGNGPSLRTEDLDKIKDEITFAANRIYIMFDKTVWRPSFYCCVDPTVLRGCVDDIRKLDSSIVKIIKPTGQKKYDVNGAIYVDNNYDYCKKRIKPPFSSNPEETVYDGFTVIYVALQMAVYMGFSEIYLLGVDCNYSADNKTINAASYPDSRMYDPKKTGMLPDFEFTFMAYESARTYTEEHGSKIYNATRGGKLEVFDRVDFDSLFEGESDD